MLLVYIIYYKQKKIKTQMFLEYKLIIDKDNQTGIIHYHWGFDLRSLCLPTCIITPIKYTHIPKERSNEYPQAIVYTHGFIYPGA